MAKKFRELQQQRRSQEQIQSSNRWATNEALNLNLAALRKELGITQVQLAALTEIDQGDISRLEHGTEPKLSTIRRIVEALGGRLEIVARFDERDDVLLG